MYMCTYVCYTYVYTYIYVHKHVHMSSRRQKNDYAHDRCPPASLPYQQSNVRNYGNIRKIYANIGQGSAPHACSRPHLSLSPPPGSCFSDGCTQLNSSPRPKTIIFFGFVFLNPPTSQQRLPRPFGNVCHTQRDDRHGHRHRQRHWHWHTPSKKLW
jgi:hypothetical protein